VRTEAKIISTIVPQVLVLSEPTRDTVLRALDEHPIAHLACHARADQVDPGSSVLILPDHEIAPLTVNTISTRHIIGALAYLSACDTTISVPQLADESIHITGAFLVAGYQNVIGTLWPVIDTVARDVAVDFYSQLTQNGSKPPDTRLAAKAIHDATRRQRDLHLRRPTLLAAYIHAGI
jgi:CHAT domain-containing protein